MRAAILAFSVALIGAALAFPATGQTPAQMQFFNTFNGVNPHAVAPVTDTSKAIRTFSDLNNAFRKPAQPKPMSLTSIFPKVSMPSWPPKIATPTILQPKNNPFQPNPVIGKNPFTQTPAK